MTDRDLAQIVWDYMKFEQPLEKADCIIGLGNPNISTAEWSAELYHRGLAPLIIFTGARGSTTPDDVTETEADIFARRAIELGVPEEAIIRESRATNTGKNIIFTHALLKEKGIRADRLIIVTKPYMCRRAYATFMKQWPEEKKPFIQCSAIDISLDEYCEGSDKSFEDVVNVMVGDLQRIREYPKLGFQIEQDIPAEVWAAWEELVRRGYDKHNCLMINLSASVLTINTRRVVLLPPELSDSLPTRGQMMSIGRVNGQDFTTSSSRMVGAGIGWT